MTARHRSKAKARRETKFDFNNMDAEEAAFFSASQSVVVIAYPRISTEAIIGILALHIGIIASQTDENRLSNDELTDLVCSNIEAAAEETLAMTRQMGSIQ